MYSTLCTVEADVSRLARSLTPQRRASDGRRYYVLNFDIVLSFGLTELTAQICWIEDVGCWLLVNESFTYAAEYLFLG
jgi:hypothetical protein